MHAQEPWPYREREGAARKMSTMEAPPSGGVAGANRGNFAVNLLGNSSCR